ncbi:ABC transporter permease [Robbsia sp. KACC 23696]|uniref:ABC transporter permease n=1 Tax=Robbsia sp. KACC 23696 TaxID=3149231 RepID=UPI00325AE105
MSDRPLLVMTGVSKHYPESDSAPAACVLHDIDLTVHAGEWLAIVGASGSGKSTLMHLLGGLDRPTGGRYRIDADLAEGRPCRRAVADQGGDLSAPFPTMDVLDMTPAQMARLRRDAFGFIFQRYHLLDHLDAADNVSLPGSYRGSVRAARRHRATALLAAVGLARHGEHLPAALSGGQQQRVSLARALMNDADVILADEPTGALDSASGDTVLDLLRRLHASGRTLIVVTHSQEVAEAAQRIVTMRDGRIVSDCSNPRFVATVEGGASSAVDSTSPYPSATNETPRGQLLRRLGRGREHLGAAWRILRRNRIRTGLMVLSIMMGIASVVLMLAVGAGARDKQLAEIRSYGADATYLLPGSGPSDPRAGLIETLTLQDAAALRRLPQVASVSAITSASGQVVRGAIKSDATVYGVEADYFATSPRRFFAGSMFGAGALTRQAAVAVIDSNGYKTLFPDGRSALGERILVGKVPVMVVGVTDVEDNGLPQMGLEIYMPVTAVQSRFSGRRHIDYLKMSLRPEPSIDASEAAVSVALAARHRKKDFHMMSSTKYIESQKRTARTMGIVMLLSAAIALSIGGIGVMNMMLVAVRERVAEIGIRIAVGAQRRDIARQFLLEALLICLFGGVAGVLLSLAVASIMPWAAPSLPLQPTSASLIGACLGSIAIGITFGLLPARQAARMDPIKALTDG